MVIYILEFTRQPPQKSYLNSDEQCIFREELTFLKINEVMIYKILLYELDMLLKLRLFFLISNVCNFFFVSSLF